MMPDGLGYLILLGDGTILKFGTAATGAIGGARELVSPGGDARRDRSQ